LGGHTREGSEQIPREGTKKSKGGAELGFDNGMLALGARKELWQRASIYHDLGACHQDFQQPELSKSTSLSL
jgi:hypothetical protein